MGNTSVSDTRGYEICYYLRKDLSENCRNSVIPLLFVSNDLSQALPKTSQISPKINFALPGCRLFMW